MKNNIKGLVLARLDPLHSTEPIAVPTRSKRTSRVTKFMLGEKNKKRKKGQKKKIERKGEKGEKRGKC